MKLRHWLGSTAVVAAAAMAAVAGAPAASATTYPVVYNFAAGIAAQTTNPGSSPPGSNIWTCKPTAAHPYPVVLVHGTFGDMTDSWQAASPLLANNGYCVFALNYGGSPGNPIQAYGPIPKSAAELRNFVNKVLKATGAPQVDIVGHSQGGMMPRYYIKFLGGAPKVHTLVGLAPSNHGTTAGRPVPAGRRISGRHPAGEPVVPGVQRANGGVALPAQAQRQAAGAGSDDLHGHRDKVRRGGYSLPGRRSCPGRPTS